MFLTYFYMIRIPTNSTESLNLSDGRGIVFNELFDPSVYFIQTPSMTQAPSGRL